MDEQSNKKPDKKRMGLVAGIVARGHMFQYWGEMITYLGMTMPMAIWSTITWIRHPAENGKEVAIQKLTVKHIAGLAV